MNFCSFSDLYVCMTADTFLLQSKEIVLDLFQQTCANNFVLLWSIVKKCI